MARLRISNLPPRRYSRNHSLSAVCTVFCDSHPIRTVVTHSPSIVREWLYKVRRYHTHRLRRSRLLAGVGVQWTPFLISGRQIDTPATLQLCVGHRCLIFQLSEAPRVPLSLRRFLLDRNVTFVGINNGRDEHLLRYCSDHKLSIRKLINLVDVAYEARGYGKMISMERLADLELGMRVRKDLDVGKSDWDVPWLSDDQVGYACVDAFVSFSVGKSLKAWNWNGYHDSDDGDGYGGGHNGDYDDYSSENSY